MNEPALPQPEALRRFLNTRQGGLVIDADTHISDVSQLRGPLRERYEATPNYYHGRPISAEDLLAEMEMAEVDMALTWQNPAATAYSGDPARDFEALLAANTYVRDSARRYPEKLIPGGWVDPKACGLDLALEMADLLVREFGFLFVKLNPAQNSFPIDSRPVVRMTERIMELGAIPAFHFGADTPYTPASGLERIAALDPKHPILAIHMGGGGAGYVEAEDLCRQARELGLRRPNLRFALSAKRDTHIESDLITYQLAGEPYCHNLCCASDAPYGRMTWNFGGYRAMFRSLREGGRHTDARLRAKPDLFTPEAVEGYLGGNLARLVRGVK